MVEFLEKINILEETRDIIVVANKNQISQILFEELNVQVTDYKDELFTTIHTLGQLKSNRIHIVGGNKLTKLEDMKKVIQKISSLKGDSILVTDSFNHEELLKVSDIVEMLVTQAYVCDTYKSKKSEASSNVFVQANKELKKAFDEGVIYGESINQAKDLVNAPYNYMKAKDLADHAKALERYEGITVKIYEKEEIQALNMGAYLGVNKGSSDAPYFIFIEYKAKDNQEQPTALVGKGVMFDTGGYSLKPSTSMPGMKIDMAGSAAVIAAIEGIARLALDTHVYAIVAATDNRIGDDAIVPDDILTSANGKTIEIISTDAEGRLTLVDAIWFAQKEGAKKIIDVATLTGAIMAALGSYYTGAFTNDQDFFDEFKKVTEMTGEKIWQMPISKEYHDELKSIVADLKNKGGRLGGASQAAAFIEEFVDKDTKWIHLDIAGTANESKTGATGVMVKTFMKFFS